MNIYPDSWFVRPGDNIILQQNPERQTNIIRVGWITGELTGELAMIGEGFDAIVDIEAEAARLYSDMAVRMRGGWTREPVHGH